MSKIPCQQRPATRQTGQLVVACHQAFRCVTPEGSQGGCTQRAPTQLNEIFYFRTCLPQEEHTSHNRLCILLQLAVSLCQTCEQHLCAASTCLVPSATLADRPVGWPASRGFDGGGAQQGRGESLTRRTAPRSRRVLPQHVQALVAAGASTGDPAACGRPRPTPGGRSA